MSIKLNLRSISVGPVSLGTLTNKMAANIATFLESLGVYGLIEKFYEQKIELNTILSLTDTQLINIGVTTIGDRVRVRNGARELLTKVEPRGADGFKHCILSHIMIKPAHVLMVSSYVLINVSHVKMKLPHVMLTPPHGMTILSHIMMKPLHVLEMSSHV